MPVHRIVRCRRHGSRFLEYVDLLGGCRECLNNVELNADWSDTTHSSDIRTHLRARVHVAIDEFEQLRIVGLHESLNVLLLGHHRVGHVFLRVLGQNLHKLC